MIWDERAVAVADPAAVNIEDIYQRSLELDFVYRHLEHDQRVLEVGCGNGFNAIRFRDMVRSVDAFDVSEAMIERAERDHPRAGIRYYVASVLDSKAAEHGAFDTVVCIRTLINLASLQQQRTALANMIRWLRPGGQLILVEGFLDGFVYLDQARAAAGLPSLDPSPVNFYSYLDDHPMLAEIEAEFHTGTYDLLTRVVLPKIIGPENVAGVGPFHPALLKLARDLGNERTESYARVRGWVIRLP